MVIIGENNVIKTADVVATVLNQDDFYKVVVNGHVIFQSAHDEVAQKVYDRLIDAMKKDDAVFEV